MSTDDRYAPRPIGGAFFSPATTFLVVVMTVGYAFGLARFMAGLDPVTHLTDRHAWGVWKALNVAAGVAMAASGFTAAALVEIIGRHRYRSVLRTGILLAWLGYLMVAVALVFDLGRYWGIWQPLLNWQGNSVLFEVAMCVVAYLVVLTCEMAPALLEGLGAHQHGQGRWARWLRRRARWLRLAQGWVVTGLPLFVIAGFVLSCMHHSSLGTLMVIAGPKLDALWQTPLLPVLFLASAMMVGLPVVIAASIMSARAFGYRPDMATLGALARWVPWLVGAYGVLRLGDLAWRHETVHLLADARLTILFAVELVAGLVVPFLLLLHRSVRRSPGWLLAAMLLLVFGVCLNRLDVYLLGYTAPYADSGYVPSIGELLLTVALLSTIVVLFRLVAMYFPVLSAPASAVSAREHHPVEPSPVSPGLALGFRVGALAVLVAFVVLYATVHRRALTASFVPHRPAPRLEVDRNLFWENEARRHTARPGDYRNVYFLEGPALNAEVDFYQEVRFSHRSHDVATGGDCAVCHHRHADDPEDRVGTELVDLHAEMEIHLGGACTGCHDDLDALAFRRCLTCHRRPQEPDSPVRLGLKGAYHQQCIGCHQRVSGAVRAPVACDGCHRPNVPDHAQLVGADGRCLDCHPDVERQVLDSAHWRWRGWGPAADLEVEGHRPPPERTSLLDNDMITLLPELVASAGFHIGLPAGASGLAAGAAGHATVDCLVCHDTSGLYRKDPATGIPVGDVDPLFVAGRVGRPTRRSCGACHFFLGGGAGVRHGDLEPALAWPDPALDVHMGLVDLRCQDCHLTTRHRIAGRSFTAPRDEGRVHCTDCHGARPHGIVATTGVHLDRHVSTVACETCHVPAFARDRATRMSIDYSAAGQERGCETDADGQSLYDPLLGTMTWARNVTPVYQWYDGSRVARALDQSIDPRRPVDLNAPRGAHHDPASRIAPFKVHEAVQPYDAERRVLAAVRFRGGLWRHDAWHGDWGSAIADGMAALGEPFSGRYDFVHTRLYTAIHHEVAPAAAALGCGDCHGAAAVRCDRCHDDSVVAPGSVGARYPESSPRLDFEALGYEAGDPAMTGGRGARAGRPGRPPD
ncbi:MAG: Ni/Fe-hydrogenase cytochrome b subunit [Candidatus Eiseniibacteriota bacterium]|jgi:octaheme c-type cytochrome (tetrathionate reductase family)